MRQGSDVPSGLQIDKGSAWINLSTVRFPKILLADVKVCRSNLVTIQEAPETQFVAAAVIFDK